MKTIIVLYYPPGRSLNKYDVLEDNALIAKTFMNDLKNSEKTVYSTMPDGWKLAIYHIGI